MCKFLGCKKHRYYRYFFIYLHILHILHIVEHRFYARARTHTRVKGCCTKLCANAQVGRKVPRDMAFPGLHILHIGRKNGKFRVVLNRVVFVLLGVGRGYPDPFAIVSRLSGSQSRHRFQASGPIAAGSDRRDVSRFLTKRGREKNLKKCTKTLHLCIDSDTYM